MPFREEDVLEVAARSKEVEAFREQYPETIWSVKRLDRESTEQWGKDHPQASITVKGGASPKRLWLVEVEDPGNVKLRLIISPSTKQLVEAQLTPAEPLTTRLPNWNNHRIGILMDTEHWNLIYNESKTLMPYAKLGYKLDTGECVQCRKVSTFFVKGEAGLIFCSNCGQKYRVIDSVTEEVLSFP
jgi:uncharacterized protein YbaR (Trm112 family)